MANGRAKIATQSTSTSWLNNAIKSIGLSAKNVLQKEYAPNLYEAVSSGAKTSKSIVNTLRRNVAANNRVQNQLANNKYVKYAQTAYKNALYDLRSGNFNNEERATKEFESSLGFDNLEDALGDDFSFDDDGADVDVNIIGSQAPQDNSAMFALTDQVRKGTEATLKTNQANMNAMIAMNSASMMQIQTLSTQVIGELNSINQNISAMIEFNNTNMNKFIQSSIAFYERMGTRFDSEDSYGKSEKLTADQVMNNNKGGINFSTYKDYIKQNFKSVTSEGTLGMLKGVLDSDEMIQMAISNPLGFATEGIIKYMMPKLVTNTIQSAEAAFSSFLPMLLHRVGEWGEEQANGMFGKVKQVIGKVFGLKMERIEKFDVATTIEKGAVPFDGITRHAIVEVITKELREQTSYLRAIATHQGIDVDKARKSADVFSYKTGTYVKQEDITAKILEDIRNSTVNGVMGGSFGKALRGAATTSADEDTQKKLNAMIDELAVLLEKNKAATVLRDTDAFTNENSRFNTIMNQLSGASDLKKLLSSVLQDMVKNNPNSANDLARSVLSASSDRNKMIKYIQSNPLEYSLYAADLGGKDLDELILQRMRSTDTGPALKNGDTIQSLLGNYQTAHPKQESPFANFSNWVNSPSSKNDGGEAFFKKLLSDTRDGVHGVIDGIMSGDSDKALKSIFNVFSNQFKGIWNSFDKNFLTPIKQTLFGTKDENGYSREGIFSGVSNSFKDAGHMLVYHITGKGYKASNGTVFADKTDDEETVVGNFKKIVATIGTGLKEKFSGITGKVKDRYKPKLTDEEDENAEGIDAAEKRKRRLRNKFRNVYKSDSKNEMFYDKNGKLKAEFKKGGEYEIFEKEKESALGFLKNSLKEGLIGWQEAFFGKELSEDEKEHLKDTMVKELNARLPSSITGSAVGAGVGMMTGGSLLGWLVGGPIGGAAIGTAVGFASKSEKFQEFLFGKKDEAGNRLGGLISKKVQDYVKENKTALAAGGALGAVQGALGFGLIGKLSGGLLGTLVGGPVLGSILGMATGMAVKSHMFHEFLFGDEATGQKGIIASFNSVIKKIKGQDSEDDITNSSKMFGMSMLGAGGGALTAAIVGKLGILGASLSPMGVIGGALVGLGLSIRAQKDNFHTWLFGEKDENGNKVKEGILGQFKNMLIVNVIHPLKNTALDIFAEAKYNLGFVLDSIRFAVEPITNGLIGIGKSIKNAVTGWFNKAGEAFKNNIITPLGDLIFKPIASAISGVTKAMWKMTSKVVMLPFKLLDRVVGIITSPIIKGIKKVGEIIHDKVIKPITNFVKTVTSGIGKAIKGILTWVVKKPLEFIGGIGTYIADKFTGVGGENRKKGIVGRILDSTHEQRKVRKEQRKVDLFNMHKEARERRIRTKNEQMIAKATGNQKYEDTEENRELARKAGFKINSRIEAVKSKEDVDRAKIIGTVEQVHGEEAKQTNILTQILQKVGIISDNTENSETSGNGGRRRRGKKRKGSNNDQASNSSESTGTNEETQTDGQQNEDNVVWYDGKNHSNDEKLDGAAKVAQDIHNAGGIGKYIKTNVTDFFGGAKEGFKNSWLGTKFNGLMDKFKGKGFAEGTTSTPDNEAYLVGENGPELMTGANRTVIPHDIIAQVFEDYNSRKKQREDEINNMNKGLPVFIQGAQPGIFTTILGGLKKILIDRPLNVINGAKNAITGHFAVRKAVDSYVDSSDVMGDSQIMLEAQTLGGSDSPDEFGNGEGGGASLAGIAASVEASHSSDGDTEEGQEAEEDDKRNVLQRGLSFLKQKFAAKKGLSAEELKEQEEKRRERENTAEIAKNTGEQVKSQNKFTNVWESIFSKKGLITAGLILAAPLIIKLISGLNNFFNTDFGTFAQNILSTISNTLGNTIQDLIELFTNGGLGDGKTIADTTTETINRVTDLNPFGEKDYYNDGAGTFAILNEDGRIDRMSAPMAKGLVKGGAKATGTVVGAVTKGVTYGKAAKELLKTGGISEATKETIKNFSGKSFSKIGSETMTKGGRNTFLKNGKSLFGIGSKTATKEATEEVAKVATKEIVEGAAEGSTTIARTAIKSSGDGLLTKVIGYVKDFFGKVFTKVEEFAAKHGSKNVSKGIFKNLMEKVTQWLSKNFGKVGAKISEFLATTAGLAVTVVGWLVKEGVWVTLGALDGLTGTRKLFHINSEPDWKMTAIATLLGAFGGTTAGCIMDIINGGICAATGLDIYCEIATLVYNLISSKEDQLKLRESKEQFETEYYTWAEKQMRNQYQTMKKYNLLKDKNMTEDEYVAAVKSGKEDAAYMSIQEYNVDNNKSLYDNIINGVTSTATNIGFFSGYDKDYIKYDAQGNKYTNNHDGTWTVNDNENEKISEDVVKRMDSEGKITKTEEQYRGALQRFGDWLGKYSRKEGQSIGKAVVDIGSGINSLFNNKKGSAFVLPDGSYYDLDGNHYDSKHHLIKAKERTLDELLKMKFIMQDGSYYDDQGNHYDNQGNLIAEKEKTLEQLKRENADRLVNLEKDFEVQKSGFGQIFSDFGDTWSTGFNKIGGWVSDVGDGIADSITWFGDNWNTGFDKISDWIKDTGETVWNSITWFGDRIKEGWDVIKEKTGVNWLGDRWKEGMGAITGNYDKSFADYWLDGAKSIFHFAKGTENAPKDEVAMVGEEGPELMVMKGGEKVYANSKPLQVVLTGATKNVIDMVSTNNEELMSSQYKMMKDYNLSNNHKGLTKDEAINRVANMMKTGSNDTLEKRLAEYNLTIDDFNNSKYSNILTSINKESTDISEYNIAKHKKIISAITNQSDNSTKLIDAFNKYSTKKAYENYYNINEMTNNLFDKLDKDGYIGTSSGNEPNLGNGKVLFDPQGNYYKKVNNTYNYYNINGDIIKKDVPVKEIRYKLNASLLHVNNEPKLKTGAKKSVETIKTVVTNTWTDVQKTVTNTWNSFKQWITKSFSKNMSKVSGGSGDNDPTNIFGESVNSLFTDTLNKMDTLIPKSTTGGSGSGLKYYSQNDPRWKNLAYGTDGATMGDTGCAPAAMSMVASSMKNKNIEPNEFAALAEYTGMRDETGTNSNFINIASSIYGMNSNEILNPNEERLKNSISEGPTILLGIDKNGNNPYTSAGHYVVADGYNNGYINIKDPRGNAYNRRYSLKDVVKNTNTAWSFGSNKIYQKYKSKSIRGGRGMSQKRETWLKIIQDVKKLYSNYGYYSQSGRVSITYNGKTLKCRLDCSGYVSACMAFAGIIRDDQQPMVIYNTAHENGHSNTWGMSEVGFKHYIWDGDLSKLSPGDVMSNENHTQIFAGVENGQPMVYSVGGDWECAQPGATPWSGTGYKNFWSIDGVTSNIVYKGDSTTNTVTANSNNNSSGVFDKITNWMSQFTSKAINGLLTGNWDTNYDLSDESATLVSTDGTVSGGTITGSTDEEKIYNYLNTSGFTPQATAGIMGNFNRESGLKSNNLADDVNKNKGWTDEEFTSMVDNGKISKNDFMTAKWGDYGDAWGYGLMQWTTHDRKGRLYDNAKSRNVSIADLATQLDLAMDEMNEYSDKGVAKGTFIQNLNSKTTPEDAGRYFHDHLERSADNEQALKSGRLAFARQFYNKYANESGGSGTGQHSAEIKKVMLHKPSNIKNNGGRGNDISIYSTSTLSSINANKKYISNTSSSDISTAINYIIEYLEAITNNTAGANDKLTALRNLSNRNQIYVGTTNNNINGTPVKSTTVVKNSNNAQVKDSISRGMQIAQKIAKG